jgi:hypothetical protein
MCTSRFTAVDQHAAPRTRAHHHHPSCRRRRRVARAPRSALPTPQPTATSPAPPPRKQLESVGLPNTEDNRRALRELLFTADGVERYISGVVRCVACAGAGMQRMSRAACRVLLCGGSSSSTPAQNNQNTQKNKKTNRSCTRRRCSKRRRAARRSSTR